MLGGATSRIVTISLSPQDRALKSEKSLSLPIAVGVCVCGGGGGTNDWCIVKTGETWG